MSEWSAVGEKEKRTLPCIGCSGLLALNGCGAVKCSIGPDGTRPVGEIGEVITGKRHGSWGSTMTPVLLREVESMATKTGTVLNLESDLEKNPGGALLMISGTEGDFGYGTPKATGHRGENSSL